MTYTVHPELEKLHEQILSRFECQQSGNCCRAPGYVYVKAENVSGMAEKLGLSIPDFKEKYVTRHSGWEVVASPNFRPNCFLTDCNTCKVYEARPEACKTYPRWGSVWESPEALKKEIESCPGLKKAFESL